ncbi:uroporphyrinogen-III synthase [Erythrobacter litoralis]|uniref:Uroporphyrinogen-III synthase n=1 Tax=Erythrobacter litoralis (strain HTCC2594) TaxID=314225 RepID=Q2N8R9_ERYLH|nr:uroporphyrinogen-III synthase [Erythrobacter litoralis]ABC63922.1 uroporphyrinogen-III synthase [Erythrobacter litoralis HTCC2594]
MSRPVFVLRPEPGLTTTLVAAFERGLNARGMPLSTVEPVAWSAPAKPYEGLLIGSANAIRHAGDELAKIAHLPVLAVGETTAQVAREAGLKVEMAGTGGLQKVLEGLAADPRSLLRLAGEKHLELELPPQIEVDTRIVYRASYRPLNEAQAGLLDADAVMLLHSGETAAHFSQECERLGLDTSKLSLVAMVPRIAEMAGKGWKALHTAASPTDDAVLELAAELCQNPRA